MDNSLRVDPAALTDGAQRFRDTHEALRATLSKIHGAEESLRATWTGAAATRGNAAWSDLHDVFSTHIDQLVAHADSLQTAAKMYHDRDQQESSDVSRQM